MSPETAESGTYFAHTRSSKYYSRMDIDKARMGRIIRTLRVKKGMEQHDLAQASGVAATHISRIETGKHFPDPETQMKLATGLGVSWTELIAEYEGIEISLEEGRIHEKTTAYEEIADRAARRTVKEFIDTIGQKAEERDQ